MLERLGKFSLSDVLDNIGKHRTEYLGHFVNMASQRYRLFKNKGVKCAHCGLAGKFFGLERHTKWERPHFNLYALDKSGNEVMMTKDHIVPKSKGGKDRQSNYQVLCCLCNVKKGDKVENSKDRNN